MSSKDWIIAPPHEECSRAAASWGLPAIVAQLLLNRGVATREQARAFLEPKLTDLNPPETLPGAVRAAERLADAVRAGQRIVIYGDYDVDGITATAILWHALTIAGAKVSFYVPHRVSEGYGLNPEAIGSLIDEGAQLIVSVDCGIGSVAEAELARQRGVPLIITDHHQPGERLPDAEVLVHPTAAASGEASANPDLCGAGVAFKVAWAFARQMCGSERVTTEYREFLTHALSLAALGTIADVVPVTGENRIIARCGLARIRECPWPGVRALLAVAGLVDGKVDCGDVGYKIAPRINAAGRMGHARLAVELLTRADAGRAAEIAAYLDDHNQARQTQQRKLMRDVCKVIERDGWDKDTRRAIVLAAEKWHAGILGIVAAGIVDRFHKPAVLIGLENGVGQGSARSVPHFELHKALHECSQHLLSCGGHAMAAGLKIESDKVGDFTEAFVQVANNWLSGSALNGRVDIDCEVDLAGLNESTVQAIRNLGPFGVGNRKPVLATSWVELADEPRCVGKRGDHLQLALRQQDAIMKGIAFGAASHADALKEFRRCRVAFEPIVSEFNGRRRVELQVVDFKYPS